MPTLLDRIRTNATDTVTEVADTAGSTAGEVADAIGSGLEHAASTVSDAAGSAGSAIADSATEAAGTLLERIADLADALRERLGDAVDDAGKAGRATARSAGGRVEDLRSASLRTSDDLAATLRDATARVTDGAPLDDVVRRLERRWPGTDEERYDRAFERGYARGRSGELAVGLAVGAAAAAAGTWLLDPDRRGRPTSSPPGPGPAARRAGAGAARGARQSGSGARPTRARRSCSRRTPVRGHRGDRIERCLDGGGRGRAAQRRCARGCRRRHGGRRRPGRGARRLASRPEGPDPTGTATRDTAVTSGTRTPIDRRSRVSVRQETADDEQGRGVVIPPSRSRAFVVVRPAADVRGDGGIGARD